MRIGIHYWRHCKIKGIKHLTTFEPIVFLSLLLIIHAGDIELNPGAGFLQNDSSSLVDSLITNYFSIVHYNVQSISNKVNLIGSEFTNFKVIWVKTRQTRLLKLTDINSIVATDKQIPVEVYVSSLRKISILS